MRLQHRGQMKSKIGKVDGKLPKGWYKISSHLKPWKPGDYGKIITGLSGDPSLALGINNKMWRC